MKRIFLFTFLFFLFAFNVHAQNTNVSATITDAGGQTWNNGTYTFNFIPKPQFNGSYRLSGAPYTPVSISGALSAVGAFTSVPVPDNNLITPSGTQWTVTVCAQTQFVCFTSGFLTITGASQTITSSVIPPAISVTCGSGVVAYTDAEVGCGVGGQYYNLVSQSNRVCTAVTGSTCTTWNSAGGVSPNSPVPANQAQGPQYNVVNYSSGLTINDAKKTITAVTTNASSTITDATTSPWLSTDVGKKIFCTGFGGNNPFSVAIPTISAFNSASSISVAPATGNGNAQSSSNCVWYSNKATAAFQAAYAAARPTLAHNQTNFAGPTLASPGTVFCPPGGYVVDGPYFVDVGTGNTLGMSFQGAGKGSCNIYTSPDIAIGSGSWLMSTQQNTNFSIGGFSVDCSLENLTVAAPGFKFLNDSNFRLYDIGVNGCGTTGDNTGLFAFNTIAYAIIDGIFFNATGISNVTSEPQFVLQTSQTVHFRNWISSNPGTIAATISGSGAAGSFAGGPRATTQGQVLIENSIIDEGGTPASFVINNGSSVNIIGSGIFAGTGAAVSVDGTSSLYISNSNLTPFGGSCGGGNRNALQLVSGSLVVATGNSFQGCGSGAAGAAINGVAGATFYDLGGNDYRECPGGPPCPLATQAQSFSGGVLPVFPLPAGTTTQLGGRQTVNGSVPTSCTITGNGTSTCAFDIGSTDAAGRITITAAGTTTAVGLVSFNFSSTYGTNSTTCSANYLSGTGTWAIGAVAPIFITNTTAGASFNINNNAVNLTATSTYKVNYTCYGQ